MKRIVVETPYKPDLVLEKHPAEWLEKLRNNVKYARACVRYVMIEHGHAPFASHLLYTQPGILDDQDGKERVLGIDAGLEWARVAGEESWFFTDLGISEGMLKGLASAKEQGRPFRYVELGPDWEKWLGPTRSRPI